MAGHRTFRVLSFSQKYQVMLLPGTTFVVVFEVDWCVCVCVCVCAPCRPAIPPQHALRRDTQQWGYPLELNIRYSGGTRQNRHNKPTYHIMWTNNMHFFWKLNLIVIFKYLQHVHVSNPRAYLQEDCCNSTRTVQEMCTCMVHPCTSEYGYAEITIRGFIRPLRMKYLYSKYTDVSRLYRSFRHILYCSCASTAVFLKINRRVWNMYMQKISWKLK